MSWKNNDILVATTLPGLENILADEITNLGAKNVNIGKRNVQFTETKELMYKCNLWCRTAIRILKPIYNTVVVDENTLYRKCVLLNWHEIINPKQTFAVQATVNSKYFKHSKYIALKVKDAIVDQCRNHYGIRPNVDIKNPDIAFNIRILDDEMTISLDSSGHSLHKRGYKQNSYLASLSEVLAAGMILLTNWDKKTPFIDPMCGSGTILTEAALIATNTAPGLYCKKFAFENWVDFDIDLWKTLKADARKKININNTQLYGYDLSKEAIAKTIENLESIGYEDLAIIKQGNFFKTEKQSESGLVIINPPYDEKLPLSNDIDFYQQIGNTLKHNYTNHQAWILSANQKAIKHIGLKTSKRLQLMNGALNCSYFKYDVFKGKRNERFSN